MTAGQELVACFATYDYINPATDEVSIRNNFCQGSTAHGWALPHTKCTELDNNVMANNTVGSASIGFIFNVVPGMCVGFSYAKAYACDIGQIAGPPGREAIKLTHFIMADNGRSVTLKIGASEGHTNHTAYLENSYITALSRPDCPECYGAEATDCTRNIGVRMFSASANGETMPSKFGSGYDVICKQEVFDNKAFVTNVVFDGFKKDYSGALSSKCASNYVFRPHSGASDVIGSHSLYDCTCQNCDSQSFVLCDEPNPKNLGWFGGCGDMNCTGKINYLVKDFNGSFLGQKGTIMPNHIAIGENEPTCSYNDNMNGYVCSGFDFGVLQYESIAPDYNTKVHFPVSLKYSGGNYTTLTNGWREWDWLGSEPLNKRFNRFVTIVKYNQTYNMTFASEPPSYMQFLHQRSSN